MENIMSDEIEIKFPSKIPEELKEVQGLSDAMKSYIANKLAENKVRLQKQGTPTMGDVEDKCEMIVEILQDRARFDKHVTFDEIKEISGLKDKQMASFITKLNKHARSKDLIIKKKKYLGKTCYKI